MTNKSIFGLFLAGGLFIAGMELTPHKTWVSTPKNEDALYFGLPMPKEDSTMHNKDSRTAKITKPVPQA